MNLEIVNLRSSFEKKEVIEFLKKFDLNFDETIDYSLVIRQNDEIVATASKTKNIIKCFAIDDKMRGEGLTNTLVTNLLNKSFEQNFFHNFVFTKPSNINIFKGVGFNLVSQTDKVALLEIGTTNIEKTLTSIKEKYNLSDDINRAMLVMNCNPFTLGHQYLIQKAASENDEVLIFVVQEDKSTFPFDVRFDLVKKGTEHLKNVKVIPGTEYIISSATFPNYFLRKEDDSLLEYIKLDVTITGEYFCKEFKINKRYVGEEPYCPMTKKYNEIMYDILKKYGVEVIVIPRKEIDSIAVSASKVRKLLKEDNYLELESLLPKTTYDFLMTEKGKEIAEKIKTLNSAH
ncbi:MAG: [citrate (pro-3S)-lyase] ligase [Cetobacterium sp.]|uniref:[citrate (pro-3S)-lyase] ligase n=1 Tax=unclassified Cetobacterium TaxID=2630983 RepID=UPI00163B9CC0|nr:[citrate (pro-3S)-lyase] ligase [Cetobacterium sp. 2A]MBC2855886.1 [citrate (pro-3S)-lyase] ligase [Cetobacterium sp. 2A]